MSSKAKKAPAKKKANGYEQPKPIPTGTIVVDQSKNEWKIGKSIGCGGFGEIYSAVKAQKPLKNFDEYPFVVKIEPHGNGPLFVEMHFYMRNAKSEDIEQFKKLRKLKVLGMPHFIGSGSHDVEKMKHRFVVMPRYGRDLWSIILENERKLPLHTVFRVALQMLDVLDYIHGRTYIHADIKGANILLEFAKGKPAQTYLVDFGLASHYTTKDFKPDPKKMHNGTIEYTSRDAHLGVPTMRSDMEILAYNLIEWCGTTLPWAKLISNPVKVQQSKEEFMKNPASLMAACFAKPPTAIKEYVEYVVKLQFDEAPDYALCRNIFDKGLKNEGKPNSGPLEFRSIAVAVPSRNKSPTKALKIQESVVSRRSPRAKREQSDLDQSSSPEVVVAKRARNGEPKKKLVNKEVKGEKGGAGDSTPEIVVNNEIKGNKKSKKVYEFNLELDVSVDADVIVNVKRKKKGGSAIKTEKMPEPEEELRADSKSPSPVPVAPTTRRSPAARTVGKATSPKTAPRIIPAAVGRAGEYKGKRAKHT